MSDNEESASPRTDAARRRGRGWLVAGIAVVAVAVVGAMTAFMLSKKEPVEGFAAIDAKPLFPGASRWPETVRTVELEAADAGITFHRRDATWRLSELDGYPARARAVDRFVRDLASLDVVYVSKGKNPDYATLGVAPNLKAAAGSPVRVTLRDTSGNVVARAVFGNSKSAPGGSQPGKVFARREGDVRVWLTDREPEIPLTLDDWLRNEIVNVERSRVAEVVSISPAADRLSIARTEQGGFRVEDGLPQDGRIEGSWVLEAMAAVLEHVRFVDVKPDSGVENAAGWADAGRMVVRTVSGLEYRLRLFSHEEELWAWFRADVADLGNASIPELGEKARKFNARHAGWLYLVPPYVARNLTTRGEDLVARSRQ